MRTILVVCAHPDDVDFGAAGAVATWTDAGDRVVYCLVTDGEAGGGEAVPAGLAETRRSEQLTAAKLVGVEDVRFLGYPDGLLAASPELRRDLTRVIREVRPDRVVTHSPVRNVRRIKVSHPDHLAVGEAAFCAVYPDARNRSIHPGLAAEGLEPHTVAEIWVMTGRDATTYVDITGAIDRKAAALAAHRSQGLATEAAERTARASAQTLARAAGLPEGRYAEAFQVVQID